jgi:hypothetical protein
MAVCLAAAAMARADTYCVNQTGCDHPEGDLLQEALDDAATHPGPDTIRMGPGSVSTLTGFVYDDQAPVRIEGQGRPALIAGAADPTGQTILKVTGSRASEIVGLSVNIPGGSGGSNTGIETTGTVQDVVVKAQPDAQTPTGVILDSFGEMADTDVFLPLANFSKGVLVNGTATAVRDSRLEALSGIATDSGMNRSAVVHRTQITFVASGIFVDSGGSVSVDDSLILARSGGFLPLGIGVLSGAADASADANHVTIIGLDVAASTALQVNASGGKVAELTFRNGLITDYPNSLSRQGGGGTANITTDYSNYGGTIGADSGLGSITETNHLNVDPGFLSATDYHLAPDSPLVDAGDPAALSSAESPTDRSGQPRIADGDGNCAGRRDIGAFEFTPGPRAPRAVATATLAKSLTNEQIGFDASASCDPDGDALTYAWSFDDATVVAGPSVQHAFAAPGRHTAIVTVTDATGRSTAAAASVLVAEPSPPLLPPPFAGVSIAKQRVKVSRKGVAKVKVACPADASGTCAGTLTLTAKLRKKRVKIGSRRFDIAAGNTGRVAVKLSKGSRAALRKKGRLTALATGTAHDASGLTKVGTGTLTLIAPR